MNAAALDICDGEIWHTNQAE